MIHVIAVITTLPGRREEVLAEFKELVPLVHAEQGCIEYQPTIDATSIGKSQTALGADTYIVVEKWETLLDLEAHSIAPHMAAFGEKMGALIADRKIYVMSNA
ncbi:MAG: putative quinol monooxygenase [Granulosicoccus sp.]